MSFYEGNSTASKIDFIEILDNIFGMIFNQYEKNSVTLKNRIESDEKKLERKLHLIDTLKERIKETMTSIGKDSISTEYCNIKICKNGGLAPMKVIDEMVTPEYIEMKPVINTKKIRQDLDEGKDLPFATFSERGTHLSIK